MTDAENKWVDSLENILKAKPDSLEIYIHGAVFHGEPKPGVLCVRKSGATIESLSTGMKAQDIKSIDISKTKGLYGAVVIV